VNGRTIRKRSGACLRCLVPLFVALPLLFFPLPVKAEEKDIPRYQLDPVVITTGRVPVTPPQADIPPSSIITSEEIGHLPVASVPELLKYVSGMDVQQRAPHGVQSDVSIRGGTFEQVLVLIDGVNVSDAQTGHHTMDLPVNLEDIERIEVVKGPGVWIYGHQAMAGAINIITKDGEKKGAGGHAACGSHDYTDIGLHGSLKTGGLTNRASISRRSSEGHIKDKTDFDIRTLSYKGTYRGERHSCRLGIGYTEKDFGAYGFYSGEYPDEREKTDTLLSYVSPDLRFEHWDIMPTLFMRRHDDDFRINIKDTWYRYIHRTDTTGARLHSRFRSHLGITSLGGEIACDRLESTNLGDHERQRLSAFLEHSVSPFERLSVNFGVSGMKYGDCGWEYWPGTGCILALGADVDWFSAFEGSFRIPTYTELFSNDASNQGNPDLKRESTRTFETGLRWRQARSSAHATLFVRDSKDLIDWFRANDTEPWKARNFSRSIAGVELSLDINAAARIAYTYLDSDWDAGGLQSKYVLNQVRHQVHCSLMLNWARGLRQAVIARYEERVTGESHLILDTRLGYRRGLCHYFLEATNILDERYTESGFSPMPGIRITGGVRFDLGS